MIETAESKRSFRRFDLPLEVRFRPTYGARNFSSGTSINLSCEGLGLDAHDFRFIVYEHLELIIKNPERGNPVSLLGDVLWKKQKGKGCLAGIRFRVKDTTLQEEVLKEIFSSANIPSDSIYSRDPEYIINKKAGPVRSSNSSYQNNTPSLVSNKLGISKHYLENGEKCRVTFRLLRDTGKNIRQVSIVGDFNDWDIVRSPMTRLESGDFVITMELESNREYRFRYFIDGHRWENDWYADRFLPNDYGSKDSVVVV